MVRQHARTRILAAAAFLIGVTACGGGDDTDQSSRSPEAAAPAAPVANAATLTGEVVFTGAVPAPTPIDMSEEPACAEKHDSTPVSEEVVVNDGKLQNVFIYIRDGLTGASATAGEPVVIDQDGCVYIPHVAGVQIGQELVFRNSDGLLHNIKATPSANPGFNISQPTTMESARTFRASEVMVPIECNVHGWMRAYVGVLDHPYFAVSGEDGAFSIGNLPPGTYTVEAWHEEYGTQTQEVTLGPDASQAITFTFDPSMAGAYVPLGRPIDPHVHDVAVQLDHDARH
ncbi:MAG: carboxypeptidase regulatory-like domain-containing protein [Longimicrobiales bacterium]